MDTTKIIQEMLENASEDFIIALQSGCEMETSFDEKTGTLKIRTKNPIKVEKDGEKITVYEKIK